MSSFVQPSLSPFAQRVYDRLQPLTWDEPDQSWALALYIASISLMWDEVDLWASDGPNGEVGWSILLDPTRCPDNALDWLGQFVGVQLDDSLTRQQKIDLIMARLGFQRGTPASMIAAAKHTLTGSQTVIFRERHPDAYALDVLTFTAETPNPAATEAAIRSMKPAGILLTYYCYDGQDYQLIYDTFATYQAIYDTYATYQDVLIDNPI